jgi:hypothetical protein
MTVKAGIILASRSEGAAFEYIPVDPIFFIERIPFHPSNKCRNCNLNIPKNLSGAFVINILARSVFFKIDTFLVTRASSEV